MRAAGSQLYVEDRIAFRTTETIRLGFEYRHRLPTKTSRPSTETRTSPKPPGFISTRASPLASSSAATRAAIQRLIGQRGQ